MNKMIKNDTQIERLMQYAKNHRKDRVLDLLDRVIDEQEINYEELGEMNTIALPIEGLYLIGDPKFNPITKEEFYFVKVGLSYTSISRRMNEYKTNNPLMYNQNYLYTNHELTDILEELAHIQLKAIGKKVNGQKEWFEVSRETYLEIMEKGFSFFSVKA